MNKYSVPYSLACMNILVSPSTPCPPAHYLRMSSFKEIWRCV